MPGVVASAVAGDEGAFARIIAAHHDDMVRVGFLVTGETELAHEAVQSAWLLAWRRLGRCGTPTVWRPWLMSITANEARGLLRSRRRRRLVEVQVEALGPDWEAAAPDPGDGTVDSICATPCCSSAPTIGRSSPCGTRPD